MAESHRARVTPAQVKKLGFMDCHEPVPDFTAPGKAQVDRMVAFIKQSVAEGKPVAVSCGAGIGRTGTVLTCYVVSKCYTAEQAMEEGRRIKGVRRSRQTIRGKPCEVMPGIWVRPESVKQWTIYPPIASKYTIS
ncbi:hypothetical protein M1N22_00915 [Dehalococcoidia bacterium]|nr:hypothetical protein [Dehalococcoidia bacterium]